MPNVPGLSSLFIDFAANAYSKITNASDRDFFAITLNGPGFLTAEVVSAQAWGNNFDTVLTLFDTDGVSLLATNDDGNHSGDTFGMGGIGGTDSFIINVPIAVAGTYYLRVAAFSGGTGNYNLLVGANITSVPEPAAITFLGLAGIGMIARRRKLTN